MIKISVTDKGVKIDYEGYKGKDCDIAEENLMRALKGRVNLNVTGRVDKEEYYHEEGQKEKEMW